MRMTIIALLLVLSNSVTELHACEACGCSIMFWDLGITPRFQSHQMSIGWNQQRFTSFSSHEAKALGQTGSTENFQQLDAQLRVRLHRRWQLNVALPYAFLNRTITEETWQLQGWGDPSLLVQYTLLDQADKATDEWRHRLGIGLGLKGPLGQTTDLPDEVNTQVNFRLSTGSWDALGYAQYVLRQGSWGLNADLLVTRNGESPDSYRYGHRWSSHLTVFKVMTQGKVGIMPSLGVYREAAGADVQRGYYRNHTGGQYTFSQAGLQVFLPGWSATLRYQHPLQQRWADGLTEAQSRMTVQWTYFFKKQIKKQ